MNNLTLTSCITALFFLLFTNMAPNWQSSGIGTPQPVGKFLDGKLPALTPGDGANLSWSIEPAFPNLIFNQPLVIKPHPRQSRLFVANRNGLIQHFPDDQSATAMEVLIDLRDEVGVVWDGGFLGLAFHPEFGLPGSPNRNYFYVYYTAKGPNGEHGPFACNSTCFSCENNANFFGSYLRLARYEVTEGTLQADKSTELQLFNIRQYNGTHRGGGLLFGKDGFMYLAIGDQARRTTAQDIVSNFEGGVIRIDVDQQGGSISHPPRRRMGNQTGQPDEFTGVGYYIPNDNPWLDANGGLFEEFYHNGHRNPHRMTMDRVTGELWIGEVGAGSREEISIVKKGQNGGWPVYEGNLYRQFRACNSHQIPLGVGEYNPPVVDFLRSEANAIIGGYVYRGSKFPSLYGKYLCGGYSQNRLFWVEEDGNGNYTKNYFTNFTPGGLITWGEGTDGELYLGRQARAGSTTLYQLKATGANPPAPVLLSQTGAFSDLEQLTPTAGLIPYQMIENFWSDAAEKYRWIAIPNDGSYDTSAEQIQFSENGNWQFPEGTVLIKHFELEGKRLETRFEVKGDDGNFYYLTYKWNEQGTDAELLTTSLDETFTVNGNTHTWHYPSRSECLTCHQQAAGNVLGLKTRFVNKSIQYPSTGQFENQLVALSGVGAIAQTITNSQTENYITAAAKDDLSQSLELRARSYLDINCSNCHQPGTGNRAQFDARITTPLAEQGLIDGPVIEPLGIAEVASIKPGAVEQSMIHYRMNSLETGVAMPPLAKNKIDVAGVELIADWINELGNPEPPTDSLVIEYCDNNEIKHGNGTITLTSGGTALYFQIFTDTWQEVANCGWNCGGFITAENLPAGDYRVVFKDANYQFICEKIITLGEGGGSVPVDNDGDGVVAEADCDDNDPNLTFAGQGCDDGNNNTINDLVTANCTCEGQVVDGNGSVTESCNDNTIVHGNGQIQMTSGGTAKFFEIMTATWQYVNHCGWNCGTSFTVSNLQPGDYRVFFKDANYQVICDKVITLGAGGGNSDVDNDQDGYFSVEDCNDNDPNLTVAGQPCNDGNASTINDVVTANCQCIGQPSNPGESVTEACDDNTIIHGNGQIQMISGGQATYFQVFTAGWDYIDHCGWNCGGSFTVSNLPAGRYLLFFLDASYTVICEKTIDLSSQVLRSVVESRHAPDLNLTAFLAGRAVDLQWATNAGFITESYQLERSLDGKEFTTIGKLANTHLSNQYETDRFRDQAPVLGTNYYRLKQLYRHGGWDYSEVIPVDFEVDLSGISVYPNPTTEVLYIDLVPYRGQPIHLSLSNQLGQIVKELRVDRLQESTLRIPLHQITSGIYTLFVQPKGQPGFSYQITIDEVR